MPRQTDWVDTIFNATVLTGGQELFSLATGLAPLNLRGSTLIRTIVRLSLSSSSVSGAWGIQQAHFAIGITSQEAFAAGVVPDPATALDKPPRGWIYRSAEGVAQNGEGTGVIHQVNADIRGARKIENGELFFVLDNVAIDGTTFTMNVVGLIRCLIKLP